MSAWSFSKGSLAATQMERSFTYLWANGNFWLTLSNETFFPSKETMSFWRAILTNRATEQKKRSRFFWRSWATRQTSIESDVKSGSATFLERCSSAKCGTL